jgi:hypothetical protein
MKKIILVSLAMFAANSVWAQKSIADCEKAFVPNTLPFTNCVKRVTGQMNPPNAPAQPARPLPTQPAPVKPPPVPAPPAINPPKPPAPVTPPIAVKPLLGVTPPPIAMPPKAPIPAPPSPVTPTPLPPVVNPPKSPVPVTPPSIVKPLPVITPPPVVTPPALPPARYSVSGGQNARANTAFELTVNVTGGNPPATLAVIMPGAQFVSKNGNRFSFIAKTAGNQSYQVKESVSPGSKVFFTGSVAVTADIPDPPTLKYSVSGGQNVRANAVFDLTVTVTGGNPPATLAVIMPGAQFVSKNGNRFSFIAKTAGDQSYQVKESVNPAAKVLMAGSLVVLPAITDPNPAKITGVSLQGKAVVGQPVTLLFNGQNLTNDVRVTASDCVNIGNQELVNATQIKLVCKPQKAGEMTPSWKEPGKGKLLSLAVISVSTADEKLTGLITEEQLGIQLLGKNYIKINQSYLGKLIPNTPPCLQGYHPGIDYRATMGTPVYSPVSGVVSSAGGAYGVVSVKLTDSNVRFLFMHLSKVDVSIGQTVVKGQLIGKSGDKGIPGVPHLHVEARVGKDNGSCYFDSPSQTGVNKPPNSVIN